MSKITQQELEEILRESVLRGLERIKKEKPRLARSRTLALLQKHAVECAQMILENVNLTKITATSVSDETFRKKAENLHLIALNDLCRRHDWKIVQTALRFIAQTLSSEMQRGLVLYHETRKLDGQASLDQLSDTTDRYASGLLANIDEKGLTELRTELRGSQMRQLFGSNVWDSGAFDVFIGGLQKAHRRLPLNEGQSAETGSAYVSYDVLELDSRHSESGWGAPLSAPLYDAMLRLPSRFRIVFLIGGKGAGKSYAMMQCLQRWELLLLDGDVGQPAVLPVYISMKDIFAADQQSFMEVIAGHLASLAPSQGPSEELLDAPWLLLLDDTDAYLRNGRISPVDFYEGLNAMLEEHPSVQVILTYSGDAVPDGAAFQESSLRVAAMKLMGLDKGSMQRLIRKKQLPKRAQDHALAALAEGEELLRHPSVFRGFLNYGETVALPDEGRLSPLKHLNNYLRHAFTHFLGQGDDGRSLSEDEAMASCEELAYRLVSSHSAREELATAIREYSSRFVTGAQRAGRASHSPFVVSGGGIGFVSWELVQFLAARRMQGRMKRLLDENFSYGELNEYRAAINDFPWEPLSLRYFADHFAEALSEQPRAELESICRHLNEHLQDDLLYFDDSKSNRHISSVKAEEEIGTPFRAAIIIVIAALCRQSHLSFPLSQLLPLMMNLHRLLTSRREEAHRAIGKAVLDCFRGCRWENCRLERMALPKGNFAHTNFGGAKIVFCMLDGSDWDTATLERTELSHCILDKGRFENTLANDVFFEHSNINEGVFKKATFAESIWKYVRANNADFDRCVFDGAEFRQLTAEYGEFDRCRFVNTEFQGGSLWGSAFRKCNFTGVVARNTNLQRCQFDSCAFPGADFSNIDFRGTDLTRSNMTGGLFENANFLACNLEGTTWDGAFVKGMQFSESSGISADQQQFLVDNGAILVQSVNLEEVE